MIEIESMGVPAVPIISGRFEGDAIASSRTYGMPELQFVIVPRIYRNLSPEESLKNTEPAFDDLVQRLTTTSNAHVQTEAEALEGVDRFEGEDRFDAVLRMNEDYLQQDWGDGFPLMPATRLVVDELLAGTSLPPNHVVCDMPPGFGIATVEQIAINAAAAGARPAQMPVIIAAVKALSLMGGAGGKSLLMSYQSTRTAAGGQRAHCPGVAHQSTVGVGSGVRQPGQHRHWPCVLDVSAEHRALVSEQDGHGHHRYDSQIRDVHRGERTDEPVAPLPRG